MGNIEATYRDDLMNLTEFAWEFVSKRNGSLVPGWFSEIVFNHAKGLLNIIFTSRDAQIVFPEVIPGFCGVVMRKTTSSFEKEKIAMRFFSGSDFFDQDKKVMKSLANALNVTIRSARQDILKMEDERMEVFVFPSQKMMVYLSMMGFPTEDLSSLESLDDIDDDEIQFI